MGLLTAGAAAQDPTMSLEIATVNGVPVTDGPVSKINVFAGDTLTLEIYIRNWSPNGELLRAFQVTLDRKGYRSGFKGTVAPVDYDKTTAVGQANKTNCFVNVKHPKYVFKGVQSFGICDSVSTSYRWLGVLIDPDKAKLHKQDGARYYIGSLNLRVQEGAEGPFTLRFVEEPQTSTLKDPANNNIQRLVFEPAVIDVAKQMLRIVSSDPPRGAVDGRQDDSVTGGWRKITLGFPMPTAGLITGDFSVADGTDDPPRIVGLSAVGKLAILELDRGLRVGAWTTILHKPSGTSTRLGRLPGDVNGDGVAEASDLLNMILPKPGRTAGSTGITDVDGNGRRDAADVLRMIDVMNRPDAYRARLRD